jgi:hypothetical protein
MVFSDSSQPQEILTGEFQTFEFELLAFNLYYDMPIDSTRLSKC